MAASWLESLEIKELGQDFKDTFGTGGLVGAGIGLVAGLLGAVLGSGSWLSWLLVPVATIAGGVVGDLVNKDGALFGEHGLVKALKNKYGPKTIPEGYIASSPDAEVFAVDSAVLARTGQVHGGAKSWNSSEIALGYQEPRNLDPFVEFNVNDDPRLEPLKEKARGYRKKYVDKTSPDYIPNVREREKKIADLVIADIGNTYGPYCMAMYEEPDGSDTKNPLNSAEIKAQKGWRREIFGTKTVQLSETAKGSLVCRHYGPVVSVLLNEAGVPNHTVTSAIGLVDKDNGKLSLRADRMTGMYHLYTITTEGNAIVEATVAGASDAEQRGYRPILNGVTVHDIVFKGKSAIALSGNGKISMYGGNEKDPIKAMQGSIKEYNAAHPPSTEPVQTRAPVQEQIMTTLTGLQTLVPGGSTHTDTTPSTSQPLTVMAKTNPKESVGPIKPVHYI